MSQRQEVAKAVCRRQSDLRQFVDGSMTPSRLDTIGKDPGKRIIFFSLYKGEKQGLLRLEIFKPTSHIEKCRLLCLVPSGGPERFFFRFPGNTHCCVPVFPRKKVICVWRGRPELVCRKVGGEMYHTARDPCSVYCRKKFGNPSSKHNPSILTKKGRYFSL